MLSPKYKIQQFALKQVLGYLKKDPEKNLPKIIEVGLESLIQKKYM